MLLGPVKWQLYIDPWGSWWWYREPDALWFYEGDPKWQRCFDSNKGRFWWHCKSINIGFWEPKELPPVEDYQTTPAASE